MIDLALSLFDWARFTQTKGAVEPRLFLDHDGYLPEFAHVTEAKAADLAVARMLELAPGGIVVFDRGDNDFRLFRDWTEKDDHFVTNDFELSPVTIAEIYRERWQIEFFIKALKQNLRIKTFVGAGANALKTQVWTALIAILLLKYLHLRSRSGWSLSTLEAPLRWNLFSYIDLEDWLDDPYAEPPEPSGWIQMELAWQGVGQQEGVGRVIVAQPVRNRWSGRDSGGLRFLWTAVRRRAIPVCGDDSE